MAAASAADAFVTLAGALPSLWVGGLLSARGLPARLPACLQIRTVIHANWQVRACGSPAIHAQTVSAATQDEELKMEQGGRCSSLRDAVSR